MLHFRHTVFFVLLSAILFPGLAEAKARKTTKKGKVIENIQSTDSVAGSPTDVITITVDPDSVFNAIDISSLNLTPVNKTFIPRVFYGYRHLKQKKFKTPSLPELFSLYEVMTNDSILLQDEDLITMGGDSVPVYIPVSTASYLAEKEPLTGMSEINILKENSVPSWLKNSLNSYRIQEDFIYSCFIENPFHIEYAYWDLPLPPQLYEEDYTFIGYLNRLHLPEVDVNDAIITKEEIDKIHWLHKFSTLLQFSEAYLSSNWYQGGNDYLALLFNFLWNVQLNQVYHPNILFQSSLSYKLALSSNPRGELHKYTISEDVFQYNLNTGLKAFKKWYYSLNLQFKTQLLTNYESDSMVRTASFLSPGDLNVGLGLSYSHQNKKKSFQITTTISPLSYNLKTCIDNKIDHSLFNLKQSQEFKNEIGSNAEVNMTWNITSNISYKTRLFAFTDYDYFQSDWENTFSFNINKFLSTQLFLHFRYDSSIESNTAWKKFMLREILSFGLSYTFSTQS